MHQTTRILSHASEAGDLSQWFYCTHSVVQAYATKAGLAYKLPTFRGQWTLQSNQGSQVLGRAYCDRVDFATSEPSTAIGQFVGRCQSSRLPISRTCNARGMYLNIFCLTGSVITSFNEIFNDLPVCKREQTIICLIKYTYLLLTRKSQLSQGNALK